MAFEPEDELSLLVESLQPTIAPNENTQDNKQVIIFIYFFILHLLIYNCHDRIRSNIRSVDSIKDKFINEHGVQTSLLRESSAEKAINEANKVNDYIYNYLQINEMEKER